MNDWRAEVSETLANGTRGAAAEAVECEMNKKNDIYDKISIISVVFMDFYFPTN